jgi:hypothetical protein
VASDLPGSPDARNRATWASQRSLPEQWDAHVPEGSGGGGDVSDGYDGPAALLLDGAELAVMVHLRGRFEPIDGHYHWYGRIEASQALAAALPGGRGAATLRTPHGEAGGQLGDPDTWGRYRVDGVRQPPFPLRSSLPGEPGC